jgi:RNA polymerase sigma factor (sigma-70 family)
MQELQNISNFENLIPIDKEYELRLDDTTLWNLFRSGNESAFIRIYESNFQKLYSYGLRITSDRDLVKDAIQDLFVELRKGRSNLGGTDNIKFYLFKCLKRKVIKESAKWYANLEEINDNYFFSFHLSHEHHLINRQIDEEQMSRLDDAVKRLSPRKKEVIYYFFYEGMSYAQIQEIMGLENIKSARNLIYKALDFLRDIFNRR